MKILEYIAIAFFDYLDKFFHQRRIIKILKKELSQLKCFIDVGSHRGTYTDLIIKNYNPEKILMFEPQDNIFNFITQKYSNNKNVILFKKALSSKIENSKFNFNKHDLTSSLSSLDAIISV